MVDSGLRDILSSRRPLWNHWVEFSRAKTKWPPDMSRANMMLVLSYVDVEQACTVLAEVEPAPCDQRGGSGRGTLIWGPYSREDHLTLGFFRNFKMRNSVTAEFRKSLFSNYLRRTVVAEFRILTFMQNTPFFPRI